MATQLIRLSEYERRVLREIAAWKSSPSMTLDRLLGSLSRPLSEGLTHLTPTAAVSTALDAACSTSQRYLQSPHPDSLFVESTVHGGKSLEVSDRLARRVSRDAQTEAFLGGALTGAAGFLLAPLDVGALTLMSLTAIYRMARCYGYSLERDEDRNYVLGILVLAGTSDLRERQQLVARLREMQSWVLGRAVHSFAMEGLTRQMIQLAALESVPGLGMVIGAATNLSFMRRVLTDCQRVFQQRWLREHRRIERSA